jgi:excinuclease UvrABC nuclease subunit
MINPSTIDPLTLPSVPVANRKQLPEVPCIYFAIDASGVVRYIGKTQNLWRRWAYKAHHRLEPLSEMEGVRIHYDVIGLAHSKESKELERQLIKRFEPSLNLHENRNGELYKAMFSTEAIAKRSAKSVESNRITRLRLGKVSRTRAYGEKQNAI